LKREQFSTVLYSTTVRHGSLEILAVNVKETVGTL
jgi:hypothetical protein